jgi:signal transduction histidine kinase
LGHIERPITSTLAPIVETGTLEYKVFTPQSTLRGLALVGDATKPAKESGPHVKEQRRVPAHEVGQLQDLEAAKELPHQGVAIASVDLSAEPGSTVSTKYLKHSLIGNVANYPKEELVTPSELPLQRSTISKRHKLAKGELAQKVEELARSNAELEQFAYVASHDLQEPLRMVANYTQLLGERYSGRLDVQADKYIHYAMEGASRMQALIQDLLTFSRAGGGPGTGLKITDCKGVVEQAVNNLQVAIQDSHAVVKCNSMPVVMARPLQLVQVFQNLVGNAIKFRGIEPPVVKISARRNGAEWVFSVADNGIDIAPENARIIFAIFQRLHSRAEYPGNGIGLAICKKIVEQQGGRIWVEPQTHPGATFKFTWPATRYQAKRAAV